MNYGRNQTEKKNTELFSRHRSRQHLVGTIVLASCLAVVLIGAAVTINHVKQKVLEILDETPALTTGDVMPSGYLSTVLDENGNVTAELMESGSNRVYVSLDEIPLEMQHAFVAIEDQRFYEHNGIDVKGIIRAAGLGLSSGSFDQGASTITQQLLKNNVFIGWETEGPRERVERKIQEQFLAISLEKRVSKDWIMENYLNTINLGQNTLGVEAAALRYFGKSVDQLSLSEATVIAAIPQNPSLYNPITNPEDNAERREIVLENMLDQGFVTVTEFEDAMADDVYARISDHNVQFESNATSNITDYFTDAMIDQIIEDMQTELGYSEATAYKTLYSGGLTIYSTQSAEIQSICDDAVNQDSNYDLDRKISVSYMLSVQNTDGTVQHYNEMTMLQYLKDNELGDSINYASEEDAQQAVESYKSVVLADGGTVIGENLTFVVEPQASMTIIEQNTGEVKALVGGRGEKLGNFTLNRASATRRQPGSTFKILTTYAPALEDGEVNLGTMVVDEPIEYANGDTVRNSNNSYAGAVTIRKAITNSVNVVAVKVSREIGLAKCLESARAFGISTLTDEDEVEALPLGGVSQGVTNLELTAGYAAIANGGTYKEPILYTKIEDHDGNVLIDKTEAAEQHEVISTATAFLLTVAMEDVVKYGTGTTAGFPGMDIAGKTGTTTACRDAWFAGYTPYYTCAVWGGYDDNAELESTLYVKTIWKDAMQRIHSTLEPMEFQQPDDVEQVTICTLTGLKAESSCYTLALTSYEYFKSGEEPTGWCPGHEIPEEEDEEEEDENEADEEGDLAEDEGESTQEVQENQDEIVLP